MMASRNRREFLRAAGTITALTSCRSLWADAATTIPTEEKMRGVMVDAARVPEDIAYYRRVIDFCSDWELNTLQFRLTDHQGSALRFSSVPHLIEHRHAFMPDQLHKLVEYGTARGV